MINHNPSSLRLTGIKSYVWYSALLCRCAGFLALIGVALISGCRPAAPDISHYLDRARASCQTYQYVEAIAQYDAAIYCAPQSFEAYMGRGEAYYCSRDYARAAADFSRAVELRPASSRALSARARTCLAGGQSDTAKSLADLYNATLLDPGNSDIYYAYSVYYRLMGNRETALNNLNRAIELDQRNGEYYVSRAYYFSMPGDPESAIGDYTKAIELKSSYLDMAYYGRAACRVLKQDWDKTIEDDDKAIAIRPGAGNGMALADRGWAKLKKIEFKRVITDNLSAAAEESSLNLSDNVSPAGKPYDDALSDLNRALEVNPGLGRIWDMAGWCNYLNGNVNQAITDFDKALSLMPDDLQTLTHRGAVLYATKEYTTIQRSPPTFGSFRAMDDLDNAIKVDSKNALALLYRGLCYTSLREESLLTYLNYDSGNKYMEAVTENCTRAINDLKLAVNYSNDPVINRMAKDALAPLEAWPRTNLYYYGYCDVDKKTQQDSTGATLYKPFRRTYLTWPATMMAKPPSGIRSYQ